MSSSDHISELREAFAAFDKDNDGTITSKELGVVLRQLGSKFTKVQLKNIVKHFDTDGDGQIDFDEFTNMMTSSERKEIDELQEAFNVFDKDLSGTITNVEIQEVMRSLGEKIDVDTVDLMIRSVDIDGDGVIDFKEFRAMMRDGKPTNI